jgi:hypothetical protein
MHIISPDNRQLFVVAPQPSHEDNHQTICDAIRSAVAPSAPNPSILGMPVRKHGKAVWIEGEWEGVDIRRCFRERFGESTAESRRCVNFASLQDGGFRDGDRVRHLFDWRGETLRPTPDWTWLRNELKVIDSLSLVIFKPLWALVSGMPLLPHADFARQLTAHMDCVAGQLDCQILAYQ